MNCPHIPAGGFDPSCAHCLHVFDAIGEIGKHTKELLHEVVRCAHPHPRDVRDAKWCPDCGALDFGTITRPAWELATSVVTMKLLDSRLRSLGLPEQVAGDEPDTKNDKRTIPRT